MSNNKKYKYVKFERLSDVVKSHESGEVIYFRYDCPKDTYFIKTGNAFSTQSDYYRREEVKPREIRLTLFDDRPQKIEINGDAYYLYEPMATRYHPLCNVEVSSFIEVLDD